MVTPRFRAGARRTALRLTAFLVREGAFALALAMAFLRVRGGWLRLLASCCLARHSAASIARRFSWGLFRLARPCHHCGGGMGMKAYQFRQHGGPEVLQWTDVPVPEPGAGEVRIRHTAVALNFRDILVRRGQHSVKSFPSGLGTENAGVIDAVGPGVTEFRPGDRVATVARPDCAYAEARIAPAARP